MISYQEKCFEQLKEWWFLINKSCLTILLFWINYENLLKRKPARQTDVIVKEYWGENHIRNNPFNAQLILVVTSLFLACRLSNIIVIKNQNCKQICKVFQIIGQIKFILKYFLYTFWKLSKLNELTLWI